MEETKVSEDQDLATGLNKTRITDDGNNDDESMSGTDLSTVPRSEKSQLPDDPAERRQEYARQCAAALKKQMAYELIPTSGKVVVFDSTLSVLQAFHGLLENNMNCAPVWDSEMQRYVGMLSVTDFIDILRHSYSSANAVKPDQQRIRDWQEIKQARGTSINRLLCISPECSLYEALRLLIEYRIHRLCVVQLALGNTVLCVLSYHQILRSLLSKVYHLKDKLSVREAGIGDYGNTKTVTFETRLSEALDILITNELSAVPIVDEAGKVIDYYSRSDTAFLATEADYAQDMTLREALSNHHNERPSLQTCRPDEQLWQVCRRLVGSRRHMVMVLEDDNLVGTLSLTQIFIFLTHYVKKEPAAAADASPSDDREADAALRQILNAASDKRRNTKRKATAISDDATKNSPTDP